MIFPFLDRKIEDDDPSEESRFAHIQAGVINQIVFRIVEDLEMAWQPVFRLQVCEMEWETNPELIKIAQPDDKVIVLGFEVKTTLFSGMITLCHPPSIIQLV